MSAVEHGTLGDVPNRLGAADALKELADHKPGVGYTKQAIDRAARRAGLSYWRTFDLWYGKARAKPDECDAIAEALDRKRREAARNELHDLQIRIARLEARLAASDPDFHRPSIDGLRQSFGLDGRCIVDGGRMDSPASAKG